ncbi:SMI1/KNR4 family protein [Loigolactobacillus zhaoyuanensis]|uniref:SMI1/KNR4 family protein n=1 Tax=Loigolactobacillus zhaoyuanensis TaxID=2486017 RepID=A0ABW8UBN0_9LACO|nr:SMI1/KNR4 family protein [Loigolactobacillus zhaoyuanensis]
MAKQRQKQMKNKLKNLQRATQARQQRIQKQAPDQPSALAQNLALLSDDEPKSSALETALDVENMPIVQQAHLLADLRQLIAQQKLVTLPDSRLTTAELADLATQLPLPLPRGYQQMLRDLGALYGFGYFFAGRSTKNVAADLVYLNQAARHDLLAPEQAAHLLIFAASEQRYLAFSYAQAGTPRIVRGDQHQQTEVAPDFATFVAQLTQ